ncbi:hypothetical protein Dsin_013637 [Dipteronia sinensis]|uniref:Uncharacterized protein n=1 Tax=Dipteronia sinensis TaxID=43782 RepID=A0AAE0E9M3_9ROSI|nr:hypothetical protein Dsin_013637 [Dipteronia sinensis]
MQKGLPRSLSDRNTIMVGEKEEDSGPSLFIFVNGWIEDSGLMKEVVEGWKSCKVEGSKDFSLAAKIKDSKHRMRKRLKEYKKENSACTNTEECLVVVDRKASIEVTTSMALAIEKLQRSFFWGDRVEKRKLQAIDRGTICKSKRMGWLGIGRVSDKNNGTLEKWVWRFYKEDESLWKKVI